MKTAYLETLGCRLNQSETAMIARNLEYAGITRVKDPQKADLIVVNTCTVTSVTDAKCRKTIRSLHRKNPQSKLAVVGCYAQTSPEEIIKIGGVGLILGNEDKLNLHQKLDQFETDTPVDQVKKIRKKTFTLHANAQKLTTTRANLKIQDGCDFMCSFCVIPFARGRSRSRELNNLLKEAEFLTENGVKEIVLTGVNIGLYKDKAHNFMSVIDGLEKIKDLVRVRISSIEPTTIGEEIFERMNDSASKVVPHLHLPIQAASDEILLGMRRRYDLEYFSGFVQSAKEKVAGLCVGTDIIAGFPGETREIFGKSLENLANIPIDYFHIFPYSERKGTRSHRMNDKIEQSEISRRVNLLKDVDRRKRQLFFSSFIGTQMEVLFESGDEGGFLRGLTENYLRVFCEKDSVSKGQISLVNLIRSEGEKIYGKVATTNR